MLPQTDLLDARREGAVVPGAVWIPWTELRERRGELPPRGSRVRVIGPPEAVAELRTLGYEVVVEPDSAPSEAGVRRLFSIDPLLEVWTPDAAGVAVDLGCGIGRNAVWLAARGWRVVALDRLEKMARGAEELGRRYGAEVEGRTGYVEEALASGESFDLALLLFCWDRAFLPVLAGAVRPGGRLIVATFAEGDEGHRHPVAAERVLRAEDVARLEREFQVLQFSPSTDRGERRAAEAVLRRR